MDDLQRQVRSFLEFQGELGLRGLDVTAAAPSVPHKVASAVVERPAVVASPVPATPPLVAAPVSVVSAPVVTGAPASLEAVRAELGDCKRCKLCKGRKNIVFGVGYAKARLMFVGEGPGRDEDLQGEPFVGAAGQLLDRMIVAMGLARKDVYIANVVKCRPPENRDPEPDEIAACEPFLMRQIAVVKPEVIVILGRVAAQALFRETTPISRLRGHWRKLTGSDVDVMPTFHPAYLLRNPADKKLVWQDLQEVMARLGLQKPASSAPSGS